MESSDFWAVTRASRTSVKPLSSVLCALSWPASTSVVSFCSAVSCPSTLPSVAASRAWPSSRTVWSLAADR
eukprot:2903586-Prymnesium_polylepis.1